MTKERGSTSSESLNGQTAEADGKTPMTQPPHDSAGVEVWRDWGMRLQRRVLQLEETERNRKGQLKRLRKEVKAKNKVFGVYKKRQREHEARIEELERQIGRLRPMATIRRLLDALAARWSARQSAADA